MFSTGYNYARNPVTLFVFRFLCYNKPSYKKDEVLYVSDSNTVQ